MTMLIMSITMNVQMKRRRRWVKMSLKLKRCFSHNDDDVDDE
jgi:hypothetical protein